MNNLTIAVNLTFSEITPEEASARLRALAKAVGCPGAEDAPVAPCGAPVAVPSPKPEETYAAVPTPAAPEAPAETPAAEKAVAQPWIPETEEVRAAIEAARRRIEGTDYENAASEGRKKYHDALTREFRRIAETYGAPKPPLLAADKRAAFIRDCEALILDANGKITQQVPF